MSSCFSLLDLFVLSVLFSVLNLLWIFWCHYVWGVCWGQLTFPLAVRLAVGAIAFASFGKEARETSVQFFSFLFDNVFVEALAFCLQFASIHPRLSSFNFFFCLLLFWRAFVFLHWKSCRHFFWKQKQKRHCVHYSVEMAILSTNEISEISPLILLTKLCW